MVIDKLIIRCVSPGVSPTETSIHYVYIGEQQYGVILFDDSQSEYKWSWVMTEPELFDITLDRLLVAIEKQVRDDITRTLKNAWFMWN